MTRILLVDDDDFDRAIFKQRAKIGAPEWVVHEASDVQSAVAQLKGEPFDVVVTDLMLPEADGVDVVQALAAAGASCIVALSGIADIAERGVEGAEKAFDKNQFDFASLVAFVSARR